MAEVVIVAIPTQDDRVWKVSSEKIPHMTILSLGDNPSNLSDIVGFTEHATATMLSRFGADVDRRGTLGVDNADVLFFRKDWWDMKRVSDFRAALLQDDNIKKAFDLAPQFDSWTPHLTLGFPATPAKPDKFEFPISWVNFDRIAVWVSDSAGPTFDLKDNMMADTVGMGEQELAEQFFAHHGVKGMKWGVRRRGPQAVTTTPRRRGGIKVTGGKRQPAHEDALAAAVSKQKAKKSTVSSLSNKELQSLVNRLNMEQQLNNLSKPRKTEGQKFLDEELKKVGRKSFADLAAKVATTAA